MAPPTVCIDGPAQISHPIIQDFRPAPSLHSMNPTQIHAFFVQIGVMLAVAWVFGYLMKRLSQPAVLGELIGGILLGPTLLGMIYPDMYAGLFPTDKAIASSVDALIKVGMLFFMFAAGLEINFSHFIQHKTCIALTSLFGGIIPFIFGFGVVLLFPELWGHHNRPLFLAIFIATALSISALPVIARILFDLRIINTRVGTTIMTSAMIIDVFCWLLFALIVKNLRGESLGGNSFLTLLDVLAYIVLTLSVGRWIIQPFLQRSRFFEDWSGGLLSFVSVLVILAAAGAEAVGIHAIFGAFLVGIALGQGQYQQPAQEMHSFSTIKTFALNFFAPLYFVSIGLKANFSRDFDFTLTMAIILVACLGKILGGGLGSKLGGMKWREALSIGVGLNARGAIEIILASVALEYQLIDQRIFVALVIMALATSIFSGLLLMSLCK